MPTYVNSQVEELECNYNSPPWTKISDNNNIQTYEKIVLNERVFLPITCRLHYILNPNYSRLFSAQEKPVSTNIIKMILNNCDLSLLCPRKEFSWVSVYVSYLTQS